MLLLGTAAPTPGAIRFARHSESVATLSVAEIEAVVPAQTMRVFDPYEEREIPFRAFRLTAVLDAVYSPGWRREEEVLFTCRDGYQPTLPVQRLREHAAWLAYAREDQADFAIEKFEAGERRRIDLSPFYLVWENIEDVDVRYEGDYGWPYQLVGIDLIRVSARFPRMIPPDDASQEARAGFIAFRIYCSRCHAINGEGGSVGPELNVAANPVEYRDREWLRRWIEDPSSILATARMPPLNPALPDRQRTVSQLIAYLEAMSRHKQPPPQPAE